MDSKEFHTFRGYKIIKKNKDHLTQCMEDFAKKNTRKSGHTYHLSGNIIVYDLIKRSLPQNSIVDNYNTV